MSNKYKMKDEKIMIVNSNYKIFTLLSFLIVMVIGCSVTENSVEKNKAKVLVKEMINKVGNFEMLKEKMDVVYKYSYTTPDGKNDTSMEKYIFDGELSYGKYINHQRTFEDLKGVIEQGYDGSEFWLKHNGNIIDDPERLKRVAFNRPTNYYWFTMMQKLLDPGLIHEYIGEAKVEGQDYDVVKISFETKGDKPSDIYQLYINRKTSMVDQFLFTVVDFNVVEEPFLMKVAYEEIGGFYLPTKRKYKKSTWTADVSDKPWIEVVWTDISFNNNLGKEVFNK